MELVVVFKLIVMFFLVLHLSKGSSSASDVNNCYTFHDVNSTWTGARKACLDMGAHLVTMETTDEWNKVKGFLAEKIKEAGSYTHYYIGLRKVGEMWKWTEGETPDATVAADDSRWQKFQPDPHEAELCGEIWYPREGFKGLNNIFCSHRVIGPKEFPRGYICEGY